LKNTKKADFVASDGNKISFFERQTAQSLFDLSGERALSIPLGTIFYPAWS